MEASGAAEAGIVATRTRLAAEPGESALVAVLVDLAPVVAGPLVAVTKDGIRRRDFLEPLARLGILGIEVGMVPFGQPPMRLPDVGVGGAAVDSQDLIEVTHRLKRVRPDAPFAYCTASRMLHCPAGALGASPIDPAIGAGGRNASRRSTRSAVAG